MKLTCNLCFLSVLVLCFSIEVRAQSTQSSYFMESVGARSLLNPALTPSQGYIGFPGLGNIYLDVKTNTLNPSHLMFSIDGDDVPFTDKRVAADEFLRDMAKDNYASINFDYSLFSAGWYSGKSFWSLNLGLKGFTDLNIPKGFFDLAKTGADADISTEYDLSNLNAIGSTFLEFGLGYSRKFLDDKLSLGVRGKALFGLANLDLNVRQFGLRVDDTKWTTQTEIYMQAFAPGISIKYDEEGAFDKFDNNETFSPAGYGYGVDLGAEYNLSHLAEIPFFDRIKISAAVTDLGLIRWNRNSSAALKAIGSGEFDSEDIIILPDDMDNDELGDQLGDQLENLKNVAKLTENQAESHTTKLHTNVLLGIEYDLLPDKLSAGFLHTTRYAAYQNISENTLSLNFQPAKWFGLAGTYSFSHSKYDTFGLAMHLAPSVGVNLFLAADYISSHVDSDFIPVKAEGVNFQLGITIPIGKRR